MLAEILWVSGVGNMWKEYWVSDIVFLVSIDNLIVKWIDKTLIVK